MNDNKKYNSAKGSVAENIARNYLESNGYKIKTTNFKSNIGEIDIVAYDQETLVFVEVKYRKTTIFGLPREAVNGEKQRKIRMTAMSYIKKNKLHDIPCRFDVLEILGDEITLIKDCF